MRRLLGESTETSLVFKNLSFRQIYVIAQLMQDVEPGKLDYLRKRFNNFSKNFSETIDFMKSMGFISIQKDRWIPEETFQKHLQQIDDTESKTVLFKDYVLNALFISKTPYREVILQYLSKYSLKGREYVYLPNFKENQKTSDVRNLLLELNAIKLVDNRYRIEKDFLRVYLDAKEETTSLSPSELKTLLEEKAELGLKAELEVLNYEKKRLSVSKTLLEQIEHTSIINTKAGYDIKSFNNLESRTVIYIEVKAVCKNSYEFIWSSNEIEVAKKNSDKYFLYLLPVIGKDAFAIDRLRIIPNPYSTVYENSKKWSKDPLSFFIKEKSNEQ